MIYATCVIYLRRQNDGLGLGEGVRGGACCERRPCAAELAGAARSGFSRGYGLAKLAQNGPEGMWKLTGVWIG